VLLRSFKLRFADTHVRVVPATDGAGCPFSGPGVDLRGEEAARALSLGEALVSILAELEPGVRVRSLAVDLERPRVTATLDPLDPGARAAPARRPPGAAERPRVVRLDEGAILDRLVDASRPLCAHLAGAAAAALARRETTSTTPSTPSTSPTSDYQPEDR
jgi:hypothetical protein